MHNIKEKIIESAMELLELFVLCDDDNFVDDVANAVYYNDSKALRYMEDELE